MKSTTDARSFLSHALVLAGAGATIVAIIAGCAGGREGDRCNPDLSHNDCNDGLTCQQPFTCAENYCCPPLNASGESTSVNPYCNGTDCPAVDASAGDAGAATTD